MMSQKHEGYWWIPGSDDRVAGTLEIAGDGSISLSTLGGLVSGTAILGVHVETITGISAAGKSFTLIDCFGGAERISMPGIEQHAYRCELLVEGIQLEVAEKIRFRSIFFRCTGLEAWAAMRGTKTSFDPKTRELRFEYSKPDDVRIALNSDYELSIGCSFSGPLTGLRNKNNEMIYVEKNWISITPTEASEIEPLLRTIGSIRDFLSLACGRPVFVVELEATSSLAATSSDSRTSYKRLKLYNSLLDSDADKRWVTHPHEILLPLPDIQDRLEKILSAWIYLSSSIEPVMSLYFGTYYEPVVHVQNHFLFLAQAAETYHRRTTSETDLAQEEHEARLESVVTAAPKKHRDWLTSQLRFSNELPFRKRIRQLCDRFADLLDGYINPGSFSIKVTDTRNYLTHYDPTLESVAASGRVELLDLIYKLRTIIEATLLSDIGISNDDLSIKLRRNIAKRRETIIRNT